MKVRRRKIDLTNKIIHGDCLQVMKDIPDESIDMVLCDMPYGTTACKWDSIISLDELWIQYNRIAKENSAIVLTASQPFTTILINSNLNNFAFSWVWNKKFGGNFVQAKIQPIKTHEDIVVFTTNGKQPKYFPQMEKRDKSIMQGGNKPAKAIPIARTKASEEFGKKRKRYDEKFPISILTFNIRIERGLHPTQKPVNLFEYLIRTYTNEGDIVLDNCIGSGTTAIAALRTGRKFIGVEKDKEYFNIAAKRVNDWKKQNIFVGGKVYR